MITIYFQVKIVSPMLPFQRLKDMLALGTDRWMDRHTPE